MQIKKSDALPLAIALGFVNADKWDAGRWNKTLARIPGELDEPPTTSIAKKASKLDDTVLKGLLNKIVTAAAAGEPILLEGSTAEESEVATQTAKKKPEKKNSTKSTEAASGKPKGEPKGEPKTAPQRSDKPNKLSLIEAAAKVLKDKGAPLSCPEMVELVAKKGLWSSPEGKTPAATLYSSIIREISKKGSESRFVKTERGKFGPA